nr:hypothetical protein [Tanacetum cinerariifolium]
AKDAAYHKEKMLLCKQEEAGIQLNTEQTDWKDDTDDESDDQELEAHYMYMAKIQEVSPDAVDSGPIFDTDPEQKVQTDDHYDVFAIKCQHLEQSESVHKTYLIKKDAQNVTNESVDMNYDDKQIDQNDEDADLAKEQLKRQNSIEYASEMELEYAKVSPDTVDSGPIFDKELEQKIDQNDEDTDLAEEQLKRRDSIEYASEMELECAKVKDKEIEKVIDLENKIKVLDNIVYKTGQTVQTMNMLNNKCQTSFVKPEYLKKAKQENTRLYDIGGYNDNLALMLSPESDEVIHLEKESRSKLSDLIRPFDYAKLNSLYDLFVPQREKSSEQHFFQKDQDSLELFNVIIPAIAIANGVEMCKKSITKSTYFGYVDPFIKNMIEQNFSPEIEKVLKGLNEFQRCLKEEMVADLRYFNSLESEVDSLRSQLETQKTQFSNEIDRLSTEYYYADHMNAILDEVTNLQCDYLLNQFRNMQLILNSSYNNDLKAHLQDKGIVISELKKLIEKLKGKFVDIKFEKSSVIQQPNAFKSQRPSVLGKPTTFSNSFVRKDFLKSTLVTQTHVSNDFSKPVTAQTLPTNKKSILKNMNVLAPGMYKLHPETNQTRTSQLPQDSTKTNKRVSFSTGVIPTTNVSRPQLKSNPMGDRVMRNSSQGKKHEVEDQRRSAKLSKNKTSVTA